MAIRLRELRKEKGLTQAELAQVINTNQSQYGKYENGKTNLSLDKAKIFADYFGVSIPYLLGLDDIFEKPPTRIRELIIKSGKKLKEISKEVGINYETLSAYKRQIRYPKKENAIKLANYFGVSVPYLLGLDDTPTLVSPRDIVLAKWIQELFSISHQKSELLQEYMELDKRETAILKQIMEDSNAIGIIAENPQDLFLFSL
ncbi:helix-turn-helix domain-containing protein [Streptococcus gallolyticus]|uniref:helix-turn-helix domain-containing protein n=1 Tax=Streptococcus gallolyticus TaxID=315405 RepID=UPI003D6F3888